MARGRITLHWRFPEGGEVVQRRQYRVAKDGLSIGGHRLWGSGIVRSAGQEAPVVTRVISSGNSKGR